MDPEGARWQTDIEPNDPAAGIPVVELEAARLVIVAGRHAALPSALRDKFDDALIIWIDFRLLSQQVFLDPVKHQATPILARACAN